MKKSLISLVIAVLVFASVFTACSPNSGSSTAGMANQNKDILFYLITMDKKDLHWVALQQGAQDMANALGVTLKWDAPDVKDNAKQIEIVNNAITEGAKVILLAANDRSSISAVIKQAQAQGIKIIYVDSPSDVDPVCQLTTDNYAAGKLGGQTLLKKLNADGVTKGTIGVIGVLTTTASTMARESGFRAAIEEAGGYTILTTEYKSGDVAASQEAATNFINANQNLVAIFGTNEGSTVGIGNAIKEAAGRKIVGVGFDKSDAVMGLINDGSIYAAMAQNPYTMGYLGIAQAYAAAKGFSTGPKVIDTGVSTVMK